MIWGIIKRKANWEKKSEEEMLDHCHELWNSIDQTTIDRLVGSFFERCELVLRACGESINQFLKSKIRVSGPLQSLNCLWTIEDDERLMAARQRLGSRWTAIGQEIGREAASVRYRVNMLEQMEQNKKVQAYRELPPIGTLIALVDGPVHK